MGISPYSLEQRFELNSLKTVIKVVFLSLPGVMIITLLLVHSMAGLNRYPVMVMKYLIL